MKRMAKRVVDFELSAKRADLAIDTYLAKDKKKEAKAAVPVPATDIPGVFIKDARDMSELAGKSVHLVVTSPPYFAAWNTRKASPMPSTGRTSKRS
jgi:hypothetical protein